MCIPLYPSAKVLIQKRAMFRNLNQKDKSGNENFSDNTDCNILAIYCVWVHVWFTRCKKLSQELLNELRLKCQEIKKYWENLKIGCGCTIFYCLPRRNVLLAIAIKNYEKVDIKVYYSSTILLDILLSATDFVQDCITFAVWLDQVYLRLERFTENAPISPQ